MSHAIHCLFAALLIVSINGFTVAHAADLDQCRKAKQRQLQLEKNSRPSKTTSGARRRQAAELDDWLWKHCRSHSRELRELERQRL